MARGFLKYKSKNCKVLSCLIQKRFYFNLPLIYCTQPHEAELFRLQPGKTGEDVLKWVGDGMQGPPPGAPVAGISPEAPNKENTLLLNLSAGDYALICFVPDAKDGKPHAAHGMIYNFKVS